MRQQLKRLENRTHRDDSRLTMKSQLIAIVAAVFLVGCGNPEADRALQNATKKGNIEAVKQHLAAGADVNAKSVFGKTPLHYVAFVGQKEIPKEIAELLIAKGADVNAKTRSGNTPLDVAIRDDVAEIEIADLLRKHGGKTGEELKAEAK